MGEAATKQEPKLMPGTTSAPSYFPFARKGNVLLGIKPMGVARGSAFGVKGATYFAARLRSAPENGLFAEADAAQKVVQFKANPANLWDAWPGVEWEKKDESRASTTVGVFLRGEFDGDEASKKELLGAIDDGKLTAKLTEYLVSLAGAENMICAERQLIGWLNEHYDPIVKKILTKIEQARKVQEALEANIGVFDMQQAILKKVYAETADKAPDAEDKPDHDGGGALGQD
jgi:hypothetical protein